MSFLKVFRFPRVMNSSLKCLMHITEFLVGFQSRWLTNFIHFSSNSGSLKGNSKADTFSFDVP